MSSMFMEYDGKNENKNLTLHYVYELVLYTVGYAVPIKCNNVKNVRYSYFNYGR